MKKWKGLTATLVLLFSLCASLGAQESEKEVRARVDKLLELQQTDAMLERMGASLKSEVIWSLVLLANMSRVTDLEKERKLTQEQKNAIFAAGMAVEVSIDVLPLRKLFVDEYTQKFSLQELDQLVLFYESPLGKKSIQTDAFLSEKLKTTLLRMTAEASSITAPKVATAMDDAVKKFQEMKP